MNIPTSIFQWEASIFPVFEEWKREMMQCLWPVRWVIESWIKFKVINMEQNKFVQMSYKLLHNYVINSLYN